MATTTPTEDANPNTNYENDELEELTDILHLMSSPRRLRVLIAFTNETSLQRREIVHRVVQGTYANEWITSQKRKRENISIYQQHLPKLDAAGVLDWRRDTDEVYIDAGYHDIIKMFAWCMMTLHRSEYR